MISEIKEREKEIGALCREYDVAELEVFGSAADGTLDPDNSDIDFLVRYLPGADLGPWVGRYFEFKEKLERLLGYKVDLVVMGGALKNPCFIAEVDRTRKLLYAA